MADAEFERQEIELLREGAMPIAEILRRDVPRPKTLPLPTALKRSLRWTTGGVEKCPMGLHPKAKVAAPGFQESFPLAEQHAINAFADWWDEQTDAKAAVDAVWPRRRPRAKRG